MGQTEACQQTSLAPSPQPDWEQGGTKEASGHGYPALRSDDTGEYVATQILAEVFREVGFEGIAYKSVFSRRSFNLALFDLNSAKLAACELHEVTAVKVNFEERPESYWVSPSKGSIKKVIEGRRRSKSE